MSRLAGGALRRAKASGTPGLVTYVTAGDPTWRARPASCARSIAPGAT